MLFPRHGGRAQSARQFRFFLNCQNNFLHGCKKLCIMLILYTQFAIRGKQDSKKKAAPLDSFFLTQNRFILPL